MIGRLDWDLDGRDWPNREFSRFVRAGGLRWHVQIMGHGPVLLLLHGTGSSTHSWRALAPMLARDFTVIAPDLPGHAFSRPPASGDGYSLPKVAASAAALLRTLNATPLLAVGHSAGAAIAVRMCLDGQIAPDALISLNGALLPFMGLASELFGPMARALARSWVASRAVATLAGTKPSVDRLLRATGSRIDAEGARFYARLASNPAHVAGALGLMANWDLRTLGHDLPKLATHLILVVGDNDRMIPPSDAIRVRRWLPGAEIIRLAGLGHLAHEERPGEIAALIAHTARSARAA
jgi:magnesium chelatase accessory protein